MSRAIRSPLPWLAAWILWAGTLWWLSSAPREVEGAEGIPHFDKICHFGYFFGGAGLLSAFLFNLNPSRPDWGRILTFCLFAGIVVGRLDEWHQSWVPNRSGNDIDDFLADVIGTLVGALVFRKFHHLLQRPAL